MDSASHIFIGSALGQMVMGDKAGRKALFWGAIAGSAPDFDVIFQNLFSPAAGVLFHRGISHSFLIFILLAPLFAYAAYRHAKKQQHYSKWLVLIGVCWASHLFVDAFNTYGTGYFEPFSDLRIAFDCINVLDLCYTIPLLIGFIALFTIKDLKARLRTSTICLLIAHIYFGFTIYHKITIDDWAHQQFNAMGTPPKRILTSPLPLSSFAWMLVAEYDDYFYMANWYCLSDSKLTELQAIKIPKQPELAADLLNETDFKRLQHFTKGYYIIRKDKLGNRTLCDLRFSSLAELTNADETDFVFEFDISAHPKPEAHHQFEFSRATPTRHISLATVKRYFGKLLNFETN